MRRKERLERETLEVKAQIEAQAADIKERRNEMQVAEQRIQNMEQANRDQNVSTNTECGCML